MNTENNKTFSRIFSVFIVFNGLMLLTKSYLQDHGFNIRFLLFANIFLLLLSIGGFFLQQKGLKSPNPQAFVRGVYSSMIFKMFACMIAVLIYVFLLKTKINKPGLFTAMGMYIVYTVVEVTTLTKLARNNKNA